MRTRTCPRESIYPSRAPTTDPACLIGLSHAVANTSEIPLGRVWAPGHSGGTENMGSVDAHSPAAGAKPVEGLECVAELPTEVTVGPAKLTLSTAGTLRHEVVVTDQRPRPLDVTQARCSSPFILAAVTAAEGVPAAV